MVHATIDRLRLPVSAALLVILLAACAPAEQVVTPFSTPPSAIEPVLQPTATEATQTEVTEPADAQAVTYSIDFSAVAQNATTETVAAVEQSPDGPWWEAMPEYISVMLEGYPISEHQMKPQIFIYPVEGLASYNEEAGIRTEDLRALLSSHEVGDAIPLLPLYNSAQVIHPQVKFLDFQNGQGVRYLTQYNQGVTPINNNELFYTFQGLTSDGKYYVSAILPVNYPGLPDDENVLPESPEQFVSEFSTYLAEIIKTFDEALSGTFTPDLAALDEMMMSLEVK
jgi:hypothetical protein